MALIAISYLHNHPFEQFGPANLVTTVRVVAVSLVVALIGESRTHSRGMDSSHRRLRVDAAGRCGWWLARRSGLASEFGARLYDMEIDALLILALCALAWQREGWRVDSAGWRDAVSVYGAGYIWSWMNAPLPPSFRRKAVCVVRIVGLILAVAPLTTVPLSVFVSLLTLVSLLWSFRVDVVWLWQHGGSDASRPGRHRSPAAARCLRHLR